MSRKLVLITALLLATGGGYYYYSSSRRSAHGNARQRGAGDRTRCAGVA